MTPHPNAVRAPLPWKKTNETPSTQKPKAERFYRASVVNRLIREGFDIGIPEGMPYPKKIEKLEKNEEYDRPSKPALLKEVFDVIDVAVKMSKNLTEESGFKVKKDYGNNKNFGLATNDLLKELIKASEKGTRDENIEKTTRYVKLRLIVADFLHHKNKKNKELEQNEPSNDNEKKSKKSPLSNASQQLPRQLPAKVVRSYQDQHIKQNPDLTYAAAPEFHLIRKSDHDLQYKAKKPEPSFRKPVSKNHSHVKHLPPKDVFVNGRRFNGTQLQAGIPGSNRFFFQTAHSIAKSGEVQQHSHQALDNQILNSIHAMEVDFPEPEKHLHGLCQNPEPIFERPISKPQSMSNSSLYSPNSVSQYTTSFNQCQDSRSTRDESSKTTKEIAVSRVLRESSHSINVSNLHKNKNQSLLESISQLLDIEKFTQNRVSKSISSRDYPYGNIASVPVTVTYQQPSAKEINETLLQAVSKINGLTNDNIPDKKKAVQDLLVNVHARMRPKCSTVLDCIDLLDDDDDGKEVETKLITILNFIDLMNVQQPLTDQDFLVLKPKGWLNNTVINYLMREAIKELPDRTKNSIYITDTFLSERISGTKNWFEKQTIDDNTSYQLVLKCLEEKTVKEDLFEKDIIVVPMHVPQHWVISFIVNPGGLLAGSNKQCHILYFDAFYNSTSDAHRKRHASQILITWLLSQKILKGDRRKCDIFFDDSTPAGIPEQRNGYDCGLFLVYFFKKVLAAFPTIMNRTNLSGMKWKDIWNGSDSEITVLPRIKEIEKIKNALGTNWKTLKKRNTDLEELETRRQQ